jgi:Uma2 family endonuclease
MAAAATIPYLSVEEYLHTVYQPDVDYVDGQLEERNVGEWDHADIQTELIAILRTHARKWNIRAVVEIRIQISPSRYRVADIGVVSAATPREQIVQTPPLLCIEVLSPEDRLSRSLVKYRDYLVLGVPEVWVFDPATRAVHVMRRGGTITEHRTGTLSLQNTSVELDIAKVFAVLDETPGLDQA